MARRPDYRLLMAEALLNCGFAPQLTASSSQVPLPIVLQMQQNLRDETIWSSVPEIAFQAAVLHFPCPNPRFIPVFTEMVGKPGFPGEIAFMMCAFHDVRGLLSNFMVLVRFALSTRVEMEPYSFMGFCRNLFRIPGGWSLEAPIYAVVASTIRCYESEPNFYVCRELRAFVDFMMPIEHLCPISQKIQMADIVNIEPDPVYTLLPCDPQEDHSHADELSFIASRHRRALNIMRSDLSKFQRQLTDAKNELASFRMMAAKLRTRNAILQSRKDESHPDDVPPMCPSLHQTVVSILLNRSRSPQSTQKVDELLVNIAFILLSYSFTGYDFMRRYLPFPCRNTIYSTFLPRITMMEQLLIDFKRIPEILKNRRDFVFLSVALDAVSLDNYFIGRSIRKKSYANAFVFHAMPLTTEERCFPLHVIGHSSGSANEVIRKTIVDVLEVLKASGKSVLFVATDGDPGYQVFHNEQFKVLKKIYKESGFAEACQAVLSYRSSSQHSFFITDFLHLVKTIRSRLLKYILTFIWGKLEFQALWTVIDEYFHLGPVFSDKTGTGKMRDAYAIALFRLEYVIELFRKCAFGEALVLLPWSLMFICLRSSGLSNGTRIYILEFVAVLLFHFYEQKETGLPEQGQAQSRVRAFKKSTLKRAINTVIGLASAMSTYGKELPLDRLTTHPLENFFGLMRRLLHDCNSFSEVLRAMARNSIVNEVFVEIQHPLDIAQRANLGGIVASPTDDGLDLIPAFKPSEAFSRLTDAPVIIHNLEEIPNPSRVEEIDAVFDWLQVIYEKTKTSQLEKEKELVIRASANSKIMAFLVQKTTCDKAQGH
jgi:hypothetical protein